MKVKVLSEQLIYTGKNNVRASYYRNDVFEMEDEFTQQQIDEGNVEKVEAAKISQPAEVQKVKPAPAPTIP